jgi:beta-lactamase regulating signal transducer with metallopeptidase domain
MTLINGAYTDLLVQLASPAVRSIALAGAAGLGLAAFRVKSTSARVSTWRAVLYAALAMPVLGWMLPPIAIPAPALLASTPQQTVNEQIVNEPTVNEKYVPSEPQASQTFVATSVSTAPAHAESKVIVTRNAAVLGIPLAGIGEHATSSPRVSPAPSTKSAAMAELSPTLLTSLRWSTIPWAVVALAIYLAVAAILFVRFLIGLTLGRRLIRASQKIDDPHVALRLASRAHFFGLAAVPGVAESELISVPVTMGALRSTILLPASRREWDDAKLDAIIAHEVSHVARRDGFTQRLSLVHRAIFWFSPLAWWLDRHLADLAEQASDEAALSGGADRNDYARTLLSFFEDLHAAPGRVWWQGVAMAKAGQAERQAEERLERILSWKGSVAMGVKNMGVKNMSVKKSMAVALAVFAAPVIYLAAAARPASYAAAPQHLPFAQDQTAPPPRSAATPKAEPSPATEATPASEMTPPPEPPTAAAPSAQPEPALAPSAPAPIGGVIRGRIYGVPPAVAPVAGVPPMAGVHAYAVIAPDAPRAMMPAPAIWSGQSSGSGSSHGRGYSYHYGYDDDLRFVIVSGKSDSFTMSGSAMDARHVEKLKKSIQGDFIWFQRDEKSYIIRDQATIDRARKFWEPEEELGKKQEALGEQQEALGKQQEELGKKMEEVQINVPDMTAELDKLKAKLQKLGSHATMDQIGDLQSEIGDLQSKIGDIQSQAGEQQGKLGEQQGALGEKQGKLGEEQGKLGEQQAELAKQATGQMKDLLDEAIKKGTAQPEL